MDKIVDKETKEICSEILELINNKNVKIEMEQNSKNSLYVFLNNTMYISGKNNAKMNRDEQGKSRLLIIAHECAHSIQSKWMQILNFILSNLEIVLFIIFCILSIFFRKSIILQCTYVLLSILTIIVRNYLEINATINSVKIVIKYLLYNKYNKNEVHNLVIYYKKKLLMALPLFSLQLYAFKIIRLIIVLSL